MLLVRSGIKTAVDGVVITDFPATKKKKSLLQKFKVKTLFSFFDNKGIIHKEFVPAGQTINAAFCQAILNRLLQRIWRVRPELHRTGKWMLLLDNAHAHSAIVLRQLLAQNMVVVLDHPLYSPDMIPMVFFLFHSLRADVKGTRFADVNTINDRVTAVL